MPIDVPAPPTTVPAEVMQHVYDETKTPFKYGVVLRADGEAVLDCPSVFRFNDRWYMVYVTTTNYVGYETLLAVSDDLLSWTPLGKVLPFSSDDKAWDRWQADGGIALQDYRWGGSYALEQHDGKYWLSYLGGALQGYETDPLAIGLAHTTTPDKPTPWTRLASNPVLGPHDADTRSFEAKTLYKSYVFHDEQKRLGHPFVMFYNGKQLGPGTERIGMAVSDDMVTWRRLGDGPVIENGPKGISGDAQVVLMPDGAGRDVWTMFYFGHVWKPKAFDTFACSYDLVHWTKWEGQHLIEPGPDKTFDCKFAHKPWVVKWHGVVYHFYCAVGEGKHDRYIAVATSVDLKQ